MYHVESKGRLGGGGETERDRGRVRRQGNIVRLGETGGEKLGPIGSVGFC